MWVTIEDLAGRLHYTDNDKRIAVIGVGGIKVAAQRGKVEAKKNARGTWLINDECATVKKWFAKRDRLQEEAHQRLTKEHQESNLQMELKMLRKEKKSLQTQVANDSERIKALESENESLRAEVEKRENELKTERRVSEELRAMIANLTGALYLGAPASRPSAKKPQPKASQEARITVAQDDSNELGKTSQQERREMQDRRDELILQEWEAYVEANGSTAKKSEFARSINREPSTIRSAIIRAQKNREKHADKS